LTPPTRSRSTVGSPPPGVVTFVRTLGGGGGFQYYFLVVLVSAPSEGRRIVRHSGRQAGRRRAHLSMRPIFIHATRTFTHSTKPHALPPSLPPLTCSLMSSSAPRSRSSNRGSARIACFSVGGNGGVLCVSVCGVVGISFHTRQYSSNQVKPSKGIKPKPSPLHTSSSSIPPLPPDCLPLLYFSHPRATPFHSTTTPLPTSITLLYPPSHSPPLLLYSTHHPIPHLYYSTLLTLERHAQVRYELIRQRHGGGVLDRLRHLQMDRCIDNNNN
jgi:hypothetical protein